MFNEGNKPVGILLDEIDTICKLSDKGGFTEFLSILKQNEKYEILQKNKLDKDEPTIPINENDVSGLDYIIE
jgi:hypothetical protein